MKVRVWYKDQDDKTQWLKWPIGRYDWEKLDKAICSGSTVRANNLMIPASRILLVERLEDEARAT